MKEKKQKIFEVTLTVTQAHTSFVYANSQSEAEEKANDIYANDTDTLSLQWGSDDIDSNITAAEMPADSLADYRGDPEKIAEENETAYSALQAEKTSE